MDDVIAVVNSKHAERTEVKESRRKEEERRVFHRVAALTTLACMILASMWLPVLAFVASWFVFATAVVVADRHIRRK